MNNNNVYEPQSFTVTIDKASAMLEQICATYLEKDKDKRFVIPANRQRPIMFMGPAGIGKTDIPKQVAEKMGIGYVSYSITHHTRQSALGLPKIVEKEYNGDELLITEYTVSEIAAEVYRQKDLGAENGILFIDEVNCVSETLTAPLLQLFQNKTLGQSKIPDGWILVMAGNPPEYNRSAKKFDAVTRDRLRVINVVPNADAWLSYGKTKGLNPIVTSFISSDPQMIYLFDESNADIVTPRGWEELSINIDSFEKHGFEVTPEFVSQFIGAPAVVKEFCTYYEMAKENITEERVNEILEGTVSEEFAKKLGWLKYSIRFMLIRCLKSKLLEFAVNNEYKKGSAAMDNILLFLNKAFGSESEIEIFMNGILSDKEIVQMVVVSQNAKFGKYLDEITGLQAEIKKDIGRLSRRER